MAEVDEAEEQSLRNIYTCNGFEISSSIDKKTGEDGIEKFRNKLLSNKRKAVYTKLEEAKKEVRKKLRFIAAEYKEGDYEKAFEALFNYLFPALIEDSKKQKKLQE